VSRGVLGSGTAIAVLLLGCASHSDRTLPVRTALDQGNPRGALVLLNEHLGVKSDSDLPEKLVGDNALFVLDRASVQQSVANFDASRRDFEAADKAIDMLDLTRSAVDDIGKYIFSDSSGKYLAPPYEKLLINTLNMVNYLEKRDLSGARVEARRLTVMQNYLRDQLKETDNPILGLGGFLAGYSFEKDGNVDEALRYYDQALAFRGFWALKDSVRPLLAQGNYRSPRLNALASESSEAPPPASNDAELVVVVGYGRVPHKIAHRVPIGLALTYVSGAISPGDRAAANRLAAQGLVTWVNYPTLGEEQGGYAVPSCVLDGRAVPLEESVNVSEQARAGWKKIEGTVILSAITRMITRVAAGQIAQHATKDSAVGLLFSLGTQATLTVLDTPDTRSWETLPARVSVARLKVAPGEHRVSLDARGVHRRETVRLAAGEWQVISLMALR
jgi:hypothetical protein